MRQMLDRAVAVFLALAASLVFAAEDGAAAAPEPTVNVAWVGVFLIVFVAICVWFGVAMWRAERKNKAETNSNAKA